MEQLELCVDYLWKSERHELIADINKPVIAVFEKRRDFKVTGWNRTRLFLDQARDTRTGRA